jgi:cell division protein FtsA
MSTNENPIIVGLDIGTTKVVAIAGRKNEFGKLEILGIGKAESSGVDHGIVRNIERCTASIKQAIDKLLESNPALEIKEVYVGIAGQHIKSLQRSGERVRAKLEEEISKEDIEALIRDQRQTYIPAGDQIIDIIPQDFTVDGTTGVIDPIGMCGVKIGANFHIITGARHDIKNIIRCVERAGLKIKDIVLQPLASAAAVINDEDLEAGVAIVDIGGGTTDMAVYFDSILKHTAVIPYAGVNITNDIRNGLGVLRTQAEQMKIQFGSALANEANINAYVTIPGLRGLPAREVSVKTVANIIEARTREILEHVVFHLKQVDLDKRLYGGIILTGGGAELKHIIPLTAFVTGLGARIGLPNEHLAGEHENELEKPMYSTCIGLILRGYSDFESDKTIMTGENGNGLAYKETVQEVEVVNNTEGVAVEDEKTKRERISKDKAKTIKNMFTRFKGKFMELFEDVNDQEIG